MKLSKAIEMVILLLEKHKLSHWNIHLDKSKTISGWCNRQQRTIGFSRVWIEHCNQKEVKDTILHEIAHALTKETGHGATWKAKAKELGAIPLAKIDKAVWVHVQKKINNNK